jgi:DNA-binding CsgD family transcriptional regulator
MERVSTTTDQHLSHREMSIARLIAWGYTEKEIANKLFISQLTVSVHLRNIYRKLSVHKETDLTRWWIFSEYGIADSPFKKIIVVFFLVLTCTAILTENNFVRPFPSKSLKSTARVSRVTRSRKYENVFDLKFSLTA